MTPPKDRIVVDNPRTWVEMLHQIQEADAALAAKSEDGTVKPLLGQVTGQDRPLAGDGWVRPYDGLDIYWTHATGAHEVHGEIRAKYNALGGASGPLGYPLTDETGTPDQVGRYNHFQNGSIYWTDHTGPFHVSGPVRDTWAEQGWERGALGYPVTDQHTPNGLTPADHPRLSWAVFENGAILSTSDGRSVAGAAKISSDDMRRVVRRFFDEAFHTSPDNVGLHPPVELVDVSKWSYGFWNASPRVTTFALHGFHDNGLWADTDFKILVGLTFRLVWTDSFTEPTAKSLVVALEFLRVVGEGNSPFGGGFPLVAAEVIAGVTSAVHARFFRGGPDPAQPEVPDGSIFLASLPTGISQHGDGNVDVLDVMTTAAGGLVVLVNPLPTAPVDLGLFRVNQAQAALNAFVNP
ncbi:hypothetical protein [Kribbella sp. NPDC051718]|uniref:LGFP repeat-containing protein n=1 Tax=Kribbella sp. NPDC051718 TaxID=3155168 RepID=UPI003440BAA2